MTNADLHAEPGSRRTRWLVATVAGFLLLCSTAVLLYKLGDYGSAATPDEAWTRLLGKLPSAELNVILVTIDTLRADRLSSYGSSSVQTPHLDRLAAEGVRFSNAASTVPFTLPAHSSLMTGSYPPQHGVRENVGYVLDGRLSTMAELLSAGGWETAGFVSAFVLDSRWGIARGFETYYDEFELAENDRANLGSVQRDGAETLAHAVEWLDRERSRPLFMWLHMFDPHDPYTPSEPFRSQYPGRPYDAEVAYVDSLVGDLRRHLETRDLLDSSLIVVTGDHGEGLGQHREGFHGFFIYDSTIHVPLIIRTPFDALAGKTVDAAVSHVDLLPTVLEALGQEIPAEVQGRSLLPLMLGFESEAGEDDEERAVYTESLYPLLHYGWAPVRSIRTRSAKYIEAPKPELYDLVEDSAEENNIVLLRRREAKRLRARLDAMRREIATESGGPETRTELDDETLRQLMALGYVAGRGGVSEEEEGDVERADAKDRIELHQLVMAAQADMGAEQFERAEKRLQEALAVDPTMVEAHQMLGTLATERERYDEAVVHFQAALALRSDLDTSLFGLARAYQHLGRLDDAIVGFRRLQEIRPDDNRAALPMADTLVALGRPEEAMAVLEAASRRDSPPPVVLNRLGELLVEKGDSGGAETMFRRAIAAEAEFAQPFFNLAVLIEERGDLSEAVTLYEAAILLAPAHYQAQFNLGRLYGYRGDFAGQRRLYEAALSSNPEFIRGYFYLAKLLMDRDGDLARAEDLARAGLAKDPGNTTGALGHFVLADVLNRLGRQREAAQEAAIGRELRAAGSD